MAPITRSEVQKLRREMAASRIQRMWRRTKAAAKEAVIAGALSGGDPKAAAVGAVEGFIKGGQETKDASLPPSKKIINSSVMRKGSIKGKKPQKKGVKSKVSKRTNGKRNKKISVQTIQKKGITTVVEKRKVAKVASAEAICLAHTSMPSKYLSINMWRAILKFVMIKAGIYIKDFGETCLSVQFVAGDIFRFNYYETENATSVVNQAYTVEANSTFDRVAHYFHVQFTGVNSANFRIDSFEILPASSAAKIGATNVEINNLKLSLYSQSKMKMQNVTVNNATQIESDDVTRVPLTGKEFIVKGNNFARKSNGKMLPGFYDATDESALFAGWAKQNASAQGGSAGIEYYANGPNNSNNQDTGFLKPSEIPRAYELSNCLVDKKTVFLPGEIKTSYITTKATFGLSWFMKFLYGQRTAEGTKLVYQPNLGKTKAFYLEKVVGQATDAGNVNDITIWTELELRQSVLIHEEGVKYTIPIAFQTDYAA